MKQKWVNRTSYGASLDLIFTAGDYLDPRITFTRSTTATYTDSTGAIATAAINSPRFTYDPVTLAPQGLLIEEQRTNLLLYSEQFDNAAWSKSASTITANAIISPDGTLDADKLVEDTSTGSHYVQAWPTVVSGTAYAFSIYAKAGERNLVSMLMAQSTSPFTNHALVEFNLSTGTIRTTTFGSGTITSVGNGWYRCTVFGTTSSTNEICRISYATAGNGTSGIYIWGAQLEAGAFATSYIPTVASQVTRTADGAIMTGTNFSSWYNQSAGSFFASATGKIGVGGSAVVLAVASNASAGFNLSPQLEFLSAPSLRSAYTDASGSLLAQPTTSIAALGVNYKVATSMNASGASQVVNGGTAATASIASIPTPTLLSIGSVTTAQFLNGTISQITYYPRRLSNSQLQGLTA